MSRLCIRERVPFCRYARSFVHCCRRQQQPGAIHQLACHSCSRIRYGSLAFFFVRVWASELPRHIVLILLDSGDIIHPRRRITNRYILSGMYERGIQADE